MPIRPRSPARVRLAAPKQARPCRLRAVLASLAAPGGAGGQTVKLDRRHDVTVTR